MVRGFISSGQDLFTVVLEMEPRALSMLDKYSATEPHPQTQGPPLESCSLVERGASTDRVSSYL